MHADHASIPATTIDRRALGIEIGPEGKIGRDPRKMAQPEIQALGHEPMSPRKALYARCKDCAGSTLAAKACTITNCPSWKHRPGTEKRPGPLKVIRAHCLDCCNGSPQEVRWCIDGFCPQWPFRMNFNPWISEETRRNRSGQAIAAAKRALLPDPAPKSDFLVHDTGKPVPRSL